MQPGYFGDAGGPILGQVQINADASAAPALPPHQQRVIDEKDELDSKLQKLSAFFDTPIFAGLNEAEKQRLVRQEAAMDAYSQVLGERIAAFHPPSAA